MHRLRFTAALMVGFCVAACDTSVPADEPDQATGAVATVAGLVAGPVAGLNEAAMQKWSRSCALCHIDGNGGAPRLGDGEAWQPRLAQGKDALLTHTIEGFNNMPPLGYCMSCEREDFSVLIDFMSGGMK